MRNVHFVHRAVALDGGGKASLLTDVFTTRATFAINGRVPFLTICGPRFAGIIKSLLARRAAQDAQRKTRPLLVPLVWSPRAEANRRGRASTAAPTIFRKACTFAAVESARADRHASLPTTRPALGESVSLVRPGENPLRMHTGSRALPRASATRPVAGRQEGSPCLASKEGDPGSAMR